MVVRDRENNPVFFNPLLLTTEEEKRSFEEAQCKHLDRISFLQLLRILIIVVRSEQRKMARHESARFIPPNQEEFEFVHKLYVKMHEEQVKHGNNSFVLMDRTNWTSALVHRSHFCHVFH